MRRLNVLRRPAVGACVACVMLVGATAAAPPAATAGDPWTVTQITNNRFEDAQADADAGRVAWTRTERPVWDYWAGPDNDILVKDLSTGVTSNVSHSPGRADLAAVLRANLLVWQDFEEPDSRLLLRDLAGGPTVVLATDRISGPAGASDGRYVAWAGRPANTTEFEGFDREIFLHDSLTGTTVQLTHNDVEDGWPDVAGGALVWVQAAPSLDPSIPHEGLVGGVGVYDIAAKKMATIELPGLMLERPRTDGRRVVFGASDGLSSSVFVRDLATGTTDLLAAGLPGVQNPQVDGNAVVWTTPVVGSSASALYLLDLASGRTERVADEVGSDSVGLRSGQIVWRRRAGLGWEVFHRDIASGATTMLADAGFIAMGALRIDGGRVVWAGSDGHDGEIYTAVRAAEAPPDTFRDVPGMYSYRTAIEAMAEAGWIEGYVVPQGREFHPGALVTRAQFVKMLVGALGLPVSEGSGVAFDDLGPNDPTSLYPHDYVATALAYGITNGTAPGRFSPYANISRAQLTTMVVRAAQRVHPGLILPLEADYYVHTPSRFDPTHAPNWDLADFNGLFGGLGSYPRGDPWQPATRGEVAQLLWNLQGLVEPQ